jgi:hypothetical protein
MMNPMVNMNIVLERELELEREGLRRTRRWIGDASQVTDDRWYWGGASPVPETKRYLDEANRIEGTKLRREARRSVLGRFLHLSRTRRQPAGNEC